MRFSQQVHSAYVICVRFNRNEYLAIVIRDAVSSAELVAKAVQCHSINLAMKFTSPLSKVFTKKNHHKHM